MNKALSGLAIAIALIVSSYLVYSFWAFLQLTPVATVNFSTPEGVLTYSSFNLVGIPGAKQVTDFESPNFCFWNELEDGKQSQNVNDGPQSIVLLCHFATSSSASLNTDDRLDLRAVWTPNGSESKITALNITTAYKGSIARLREKICVDRPCEITITHLILPSKFDQELEFDIKLKTDFVQNSHTEEIIFPSIINFKGKVECPLALGTCHKRIYQMCMNSKKDSETLEKCKSLLLGQGLR
jgi:hypothetical protein